MENDPTARLLALLGLLQSRPEWTAQELAARNRTSLRTVRRDVARLRSLGYSICNRPGPHSCYRLGPGLAVPPLLFSADEVTALVTGLRILQQRLPGDPHPAAALAKLEQVWPALLRRRAVATRQSVEVLDAFEPTAGPAETGLVADAIAEQGRLRFDYVDRDGRRSVRSVDPHLHVLSATHGYLVGWDVDRQDWRLFRFDRIASLQRVPGTFARHEFPETSVQQWLTTDFGRTGPGSSLR